MDIFAYAMAKKMLGDSGGGSTVISLTAGRPTKDDPISSIGSDAVINCVNAYAIGEHAFKNFVNLVSATLPKATIIDSYAFSECHKLEVVHAPNVTTVYDGAFNNNDKLKTINTAKLRRVGEYCFYNCLSLESVTLENDDLAFVIMGTSAFHGCTALKNVGILDRIMEVPDGAFRYCKELEYDECSLNVTRIGDSAFEGCSKLKRINVYGVIPHDNGEETVVSDVVLGDSAFADCTSLERIIIGDGYNNNHLTINIGARAFARTPQLRHIVLKRNTVAIIDLTAFEDSYFIYHPEYGTNYGWIYVPSVMYEYYRAGYEETINSLMPGLFDTLFRKIEDYPEICG